MTEQTTPREPPELILTTWEHFIAFGFGSGLSPIAPGTVGTLVAMPLAWAVAQLLPLQHALVCAVLFVFGCWICGRSAKLLRVHDHGGIVFDEFVGIAITVAPLAGAAQPWWAWPAAFALFRFFDVLKPWPIGWLDRRIHGGIGIMLDDALAGLLSAAALYGLLDFISR